MAKFFSIYYKFLFHKSLFVRRTYRAPLHGIITIQSYRKYE
uniref:Uncharacterized protein n=1 Tax=Myoviridae sp. ctP6q2 TaxID=2825096 RepID=A0A8S5UUN6_9CAUD|nr:MAG TPA: hypothetical protein [Myoviridae sp. ctP6q2]